MNAERGWTQQIHYGAMRNNNTKMFEKLGADVGFDSIGDFEIGKPLSRLMDKLNMQGKLAKTILYNLNPSDNYLLATMLGNFQGPEIPGKIQFGSGWWFLDQMEGMTQHIEAVSQEGLLSRFVGMLTDSRSFLSYTRHEYFRRILCNILGNDMAKGLIPNDMKLVGNMVKDISYNNAATYFGFENLKTY
jgi:glucuronate isomerase